jgi:hypothetical protein
MTVSIREMMLRGVGVSCRLIAESQQQVLRNVSAVVLKRFNSTAAVAQARPEEWEYAKPFEDIPGPKPLPIIGNIWRFIPYLGNVTYCFLLCLRSINKVKVGSKNVLYPSARIFYHRKESIHFLMFISVIL